MPVCVACKIDGPDGPFCSNCGATRSTMSCTRCGTALSAGSRFCQQCGSPVSAQPVAPAVVALPAAPRSSSRAPILIAGAAAAALLILVITQQMGSGTAPQSPEQAAPTAPGVRAPDISQMTPRERAARLFDRIMRLDEEGKKDSVMLFASMAIPTFQSLQPLDAHLRYDLGRVAAAAGELDLAQAQADTILRARPQHLLGLILAIKTAEARGDNAAAARLRARLVAAEASERAANLEEYQLHDADIRIAVAAARDAR